MISLQILRTRSRAIPALVVVAVMALLLAACSSAQPAAAPTSVPTQGASVPPPDSAPIPSSAEPVVPESTPTAEAEPTAPQTTPATSPATVFVDVSLSFSEPPVLGREVTLTLSVVWPKKDVATGTVDFEVPEEGFEVLSGAIHWEGSFAAKEEKLFSLVVKAIATGEWVVTAKTLSHLGKGSFEGKPARLFVSITDSGATSTSRRSSGPPRGNVTVPARKLEETPTPTPK